MPNPKKPHFKKTKEHIELSKKAMEVLKNTDYSKCTAEMMDAQIRRIEQEAFAQNLKFNFQKSKFYE